MGNKGAGSMVYCVFPSSDTSWCMQTHPSSKENKNKNKNTGGYIHRFYGSPSGPEWSCNVMHHTFTFWASAALFSFQPSLPYLASVTQEPAAVSSPNWSSWRHKWSCFSACMIAAGMDTWWQNRRLFSSAWPHSSSFPLLLQEAFTFPPSLSTGCH